MNRRRARVGGSPFPPELTVGGDPEAWLVANQNLVQDLLDASGAVLLHSDPAETTLLDVYRSVTGYEAMEYTDQHTPRTKVSDTAYTSTEYPSSLRIPFHSENSKNKEWPLIIAFYCVSPAAVGGATPIADNAVVLNRLPAAIVDKFVSEGGVKYVRNFHDGLGVSWRRAFRVDTLDELHAWCLKEGLDVKLSERSILTVSHVRPALMDHWRTGQLLWFNQAQLFHPAALDARVRAELGAFGDESSFPSYVEYGSGERIADRSIEQISAAFSASGVDVRWKTGDLLILDNMQVAHSRSPFNGRRRILVSMFLPHKSLV